MRIAQRYQAQVTLNEVAMAAADQINALQGGAPDTAKAQELLENIKMASERMQSKRGALLMVPKDYREAWEELQQHVVYIVTLQNAFRTKSLSVHRWISAHFL